MEMIWFLLVVILMIILAGELLTALIYGVVLIWRISVKSGHIQKAKSMKDRYFDTRSKALTEACRSLDAVLRVYEDTEGEPVCIIGENQYQKINIVRNSLRKHGVIRRLKFLDVSAEQKKSGQIYRKWDQGGKEWRACELGASAVDEYLSQADGKTLMSAYYPFVRIYFSMSRRLASKERTASNQKDKWGRKIVKNDIFYRDQHIKNCPSCSADLPDGIKDIVCPYCGSTIFSDYYDWQLESLEIEPEHLKLRGFIGWMIIVLASGGNGSRVKKRTKQKIVRFSENDFRQDVYESVLKDELSENLIDLWLGEIEIRKITNTDKDTILKTAFPVNKTVIRQGTDGALKIDHRCEFILADFMRNRYPDRFMKQGKVVSGERCCPACGAAFTPDEDGNCIHCGSFLFKENYKWRVVQ